MKLFFFSSLLFWTLSVFFYESIDPRWQLFFISISSAACLYILFVEHRIRFFNFLFVMGVLSFLGNNYTQNRSIYVQDSFDGTYVAYSNCYAPFICFEKKYQMYKRVSYTPFVYPIFGGEGEVTGMFENDEVTFYQLRLRLGGEVQVFPMNVVN